jgi:4-hydroxy-tetrahydrodipicolinate synthase
MKFTDVIVATVLPFDVQGSIDWPSYRRLLDYCCAPASVSTIFVNGHAGESASLTPEERIEVIRFTREYLGGRKRLVAGVVPYSTADAVAQARDARDSGAECVVLFPPPLFQLGGSQTPAAPIAYIKAVHDDVGLPIGIFQYPLAGGLGYPTPVLIEIAKAPGVVMIKEGSGDVIAYEDNVRAVKAVAPHVSMMPTNSGWFLAQAAIGSDGILSGLGSLTPNFLCDMWEATQAENLRAMRAAGDRLYPVVRTIYGAPPKMDMHTRIKVGLRHLGIIEYATPRGPLLPVSPEVEQRVVDTVERAGLAQYARAALAPERRFA